MSPQEKADYLGELEIFAELEDDELAALARITSEYEFDEQATIAYQRDIAEEFLIVVEGRLFARRMDGHGLVRESRSYFPGHYFNDLWLLEAHAHPATVQGVEAGRVLAIRREDFLEFLDEYEEALDYLNLSDEAQAVADQRSLSSEESRPPDLSLTAEEQILFWERRSAWRLMLEIIPAVGVFLGWAIFILFYTTLPRTWATLVILVPGMLAALILIWRSLDWANDYFVVTNKHLVHHEYSLRGLQVAVVKIPLDQVQSVEIERPSLLATLLGVGTASATTAASEGAIRFDWIDNPQEVADIINRQREHSSEVDAGQTQAALRATLERHYQSDPAYRRVDIPDDEEVRDDLFEEDMDFSDAFAAGLLGGLSRLGRFLGTRLVDGDVITYRKHPFTLFVRTWWLWLLFLGALAAAARIGDSVISSALGGLAFLIFLWLTWRYLDWRNDLFQVTNRYILDIDRLPLGFGEKRKQAELGNVQNVSASRPGLFPTMLNFGNVNIETAGASPDIVFERVSNPGRVQSDIFERRDAFLARQRAADREQRRKEFAVMLDVYQQAQESGRIPRRMPPPHGQTSQEESEER